MAIIICPNCGNEISDKMDFCPHCKTPMSVILSQKPKKKRTTPVLVPVLSVLDGLVLLGTVGLLTWGVMNPTVISPTAMESAVTSTGPGTACSIISTLQGNAAKNYNRYHHDVPAAQSEPLAPITEGPRDAGTIEPKADQVTPLSGESAESPEQNSTPQQEAQAPQQSVASVQETNPTQSTPREETTTEQTTQSNNTSHNTSQNSGSGSGGNGNNFNTYNNQEQTKTDDKWVLNTNTKKIHYPNCRDVPKIAPQNYSTSNAEESELLNQGYTTCGHCH